MQGLRRKYLSWTALGIGLMLCAVGPALSSGDPVIVLDILPGDVDFDGDVDMDDFQEFEGCFDGPGVPVPWDPCGPSDTDLDGDVDLADVATFQENYTGCISNCD